METIQRDSLGRFLKGRQVPEGIKKKISESNKGRIVWNKLSNIKMECSYCKNLFMVHPCDLKKYSSRNNAVRKFCTTACYHKYLKTRLADGFYPGKVKDKINRICPICQNVFMVTVSNEKQKYCSQKCYWEAMHKIHIGDKASNWQGGITSLQESIRNCKKSLLWKKNIFCRDNWKCQLCGEIGGKLVAHHIKPFASIIKEFTITRKKDALKCKALWDVNNGVTLCEYCHRIVEKTIYKNRKQFYSDNSYFPNVVKFNIGLKRSDKLC